MKEPEVFMGDTVSIGIVIGTLADYLPTIAAALSVIWFAIRIWESETIRTLTGRERRPPRADDGDQ